MEFQTGDVVRVGKGEQWWTIRALHTTGEVELQSDPSRAEIAGSPSRRKMAEQSRLTILQYAGTSGAFSRMARRLGINPRHCPGCWDEVQWALTREEEGEEF